jgi:hypothetical protein
LNEVECGPAIQVLTTDIQSNPELPSPRGRHAPARRLVPRLHRPAWAVLAERLQQPAAGHPLPRAAHVDGPLVLAQTRPMVAGVGLRQPSRRAHGAARVRLATARLDTYSPSRSCRSLLTRWRSANLVCCESHRGGVECRIGPQSSGRRLRGTRPRAATERHQVAIIATH